MMKKVRSMTKRKKHSLIFSYWSCELLHWYLLVWIITSFFSLYFGSCYVHLYLSQEKRTVNCIVFFSSKKRKSNRVKETSSRLCLYFYSQFYSSLLMYATHDFLFLLLPLLLRYLFPSSALHQNAFMSRVSSYWNICFHLRRILCVSVVYIYCAAYSCSRFVNRTVSLFLPRTLLIPACIHRFISRLLSNSIHFNFNSSYRSLFRPRWACIYMYFVAICPPFIQVYCRFMFVCFFVAFSLQANKDVKLKLYPWHPTHINTRTCARAHIR